MIDIADGKTLNIIELHKNMTKLPYTDIHIVSATSANLTYLIMTNNEVRSFHFAEETWSMKCADNELLVYVGYDTARESVVIATVLDGGEEVSSRPVNGALKPFTFMFNPYTDILLKTWQYVLVIRMPPHSKSTMIIAHRPEKREMLFNDLEREAGADFQVCDRG